jgi:hypothetical protein
MRITLPPPREGLARPLAIYRSCPVPLWSAPAKRSDDGAFERTKIPLHSIALRAYESGVAASLCHRTPKWLAVPLAGIAGPTVGIDVSPLFPPVKFSSENLLTLLLLESLKAMGYENFIQYWRVLPGDRAVR